MFCISRFDSHHGYVRALDFTVELNALNIHLFIIVIIMEELLLRMCLTFKLSYGTRT